MTMHLESNQSYKDIYNNGLQFMKAAWKCFGSYKDGDFYFIDDGEICILPVPCVVNASFACEMFLKSILKLASIEYPCKHDLIILFRLLKTEDKNTINKFFNQSF